MHVAHPDGEAKFWLTPEVHLAVNVGLSPGTATLEVEVTNISPTAFWVLLGAEELPVPYEQFPWFKLATVEQLCAVERPTENHLYWPLLDVDLSVESLRIPEAFPLMSRVEG